MLRRRTRTRIHEGYKYFGRPSGDGKQSERISSLPTDLETGGTRTVYSCPWDQRLMMKVSPWNQSAEKSWLLKLENMSVKIQGAGTIQAEIEGRNGTRSKEIWSVTLATRASPVTGWDTTRAWELALLVATSSQVANICDIGRSNVCQHPGVWVSPAHRRRNLDKSQCVSQIPQQNPRKRVLVVADQRTIRGGCEGCVAPSRTMELQAVRITSQAWRPARGKVLVDPGLV